jgi:hypothetical protein
MSFYFSSNHVIYHSHIPRTGGTSVQEWLNSEGMPVRGVSSDKPPCALQHRHLSDDTLKQDIATYEPDVFFAVIRHPVDRLKSLWKMRYGSGKFVNPSSEFELYVKNSLELQKRDEYHENNSLRPQVEFVDDRFELFAIDDVSKAHYWLEQSCKLALRKFPCEKHNPTTFDFVVNSETIVLIESSYRADMELYRLLKDA